MTGRSSGTAAAIGLAGLVGLGVMTLHPAAQTRPTGDTSTSVRIGVLRDGSYAVRTMPLEAYVSGVLAGEAARESPPASLETLAIAIRTYTVANAGRHRSDGFDLCDQTHCQVLRPTMASTDLATSATAGQILVDRDGQPAEIFYSASCGGRSEVPSAVWPGAVDHEYLPSRGDEACGGEPVWSAEVSAEELSRLLRAAGYRGRELRDLRIAGRTVSGRAGRVQIDGFEPGELSGQELRMAVGPTRLRSAAFEVQRQGQVYRFDGRGYGHGVGLCVMGSVQRASAGRRAAEILATYFPGTRIANAAGRARTAPTAPAPKAAQAAVSGVTLVLPPADEAWRAALVKMIAAGHDALTSTLSLPSPVPLRARFHASAADYQEATKLPWYTNGALVSGEMHFLPVDSLEGRGLLERTVRHEIVHALTDRFLVDRPLWVREGAAVYYSVDRKPGETGPRLECPTDADIRQATSPGALSLAYSEAVSCFARQIASGRSWLDVR
jgi:stage II sporulation protein D